MTARRVLILSQAVHPIPPEKGAAVEQWIDAVAHKLDRWDPLVISVPHSARPDSERSGTVRYERVRIGSLYTRLFRKLTRLDPWPYLDRVSALAKRFKPDLIHLHNAPEFVDGLASRMRGVPIVLHMHNTLPPRFSSRVAALIGCSRYVVDWYCGRGIHSPIVDVLPNGVDTKRLSPADSAQRADLKAEHGIPSDRFTILYVGRMTEEKGPDRLVEAFSLLDPERFHLVLLGEWRARSKSAGDKRAAFAEYLSGLVERLQKGSVTVLGLFPPDVAQKLYGLADLLVIPSRFEEPFSMVAIEAMVSGVPVLAVRRGGMPEYMRHGQNALLMDGDSSPEAIASEVESAAANPGRLKEMAVEARRMVESRFSWEEVASQTQALYERVLESSVNSSGKLSN